MQGWDRTPHLGEEVAVPALPHGPADSHSCAKAPLRCASLGRPLESGHWVSPGFGRGVVRPAPMARGGRLGAFRADPSELSSLALHGDPASHGPLASNGAGRAKLLPNPGLAHVLTLMQALSPRQLEPPGQRGACRAPTAVPPQAMADAQAQTYRSSRSHRLPPKW